jgi:hypothetical protein
MAQVEMLWSLLLTLRYPQVAMSLRPLARLVLAQVAHCRCPRDQVLRTVGASISVLEPVQLALVECYRLLQARLLTAKVEIPCCLLGVVQPVVI